MPRFTIDEVETRDDNWYRITDSTDSDSATFSTERQVTFNVEVDTERIVEEIRESISTPYFSFSSLTAETADEPGDFERDTMPSMDLPTIDVWYYQQLAARYGGDHAGEIYAGRAEAPDGLAGVPALREVLLSDYADSVLDSIERLDDNDREETAFNDETSDWPIRARAYLAAHMLREDGDDDRLTDRFCRELEDFARSEGLFDYDMVQATLDCYYADNPFTEGELTHTEATTLMWMRTIGDWQDEFENEREIIDRIESHGNFRDWLKRENDVGAALRGHLYDSDLPDGLATVAAAPEDWPGDMDSTDIEECTCRRCATEYYRIFDHEGEVSWRHETGDRNDVLQIDADTPLEFHDASQGQRDLGYAVCESCFEDWQENTNTVTLYHGTTVCRIASYDNLLLDFGSIDGSGFTPRSSVPRDLRNDALDMVRGGIPDNYISLSPSDGPGSSVEKHAILERLSDGVTTDMPDETLFIMQRTSTFGDSSSYVLVRRDDWDAATEAKELLEEAGTDGFERDDYQTLDIDMEAALNV
jgi:hypothetical protein